MKLLTMKLLSFAKISVCHSHNFHQGLDLTSCCLTGPCQDLYEKVLQKYLVDYNSQSYHGGGKQTRVENLPLKYLQRLCKMYFMVPRKAMIYEKKKLLVSGSV